MKFVAILCISLALASCDDENMQQSLMGGGQGGTMNDPDAATMSGTGLNETTLSAYDSGVNSTEFGYVDSPSGSFHGNGDPNTGGAWYLGDSNNYIGGTDSIGVAVPTSVQVAQYGSTQAAFGQMVTLTNPQNGMSTTAPIVDISPEGKPLDMVYGTVQALGLPHNSTSVIQLQFNK